ncbi:hypothetical protein DIS18_14670 [Algibacter marinivivus]|uniref:Uncharacterized protein n=1 Tax=Algibacter marinivivus TaxID=2100723 RepID=A0A2U2X160_9FLAO|nr:hypothetical protein [Algibacter marinivivus]PWH81521.1 hypothetical protein DIS18_14670 [Algibacter marinivivus]
MTLNKEHIAFRLLTFLLVSALLIPSTVKLIHVFEHHEHVVCIGDDSTHIHKVDLDCEFQKFQITNYFTPVLSNYDSTVVDYTYKVSYLTYKFLNNHRPLSFSLRGPPVLV